MNAPNLTARLRSILTSRKKYWEEKKMMGGLCFMVDDKMCFGTYKGGLIVRIEPDEVETLIQKRGAEAMIMGERRMKGYLSIRPEGFADDTDLEFWITKCLEFNPKAKSSKKK